MSRYIDADLLKDKTTRVNNIWNSTTNAEGKGLDEIIDDIQTADVRKNVRGEWIPMRRFGGEKGQTPDVMCSVCHAPALWLGTLGCIRSNYCPNCGADMRGGDAE